MTSPHKGFTVWLTGRSGAGKSTLSRLLEQRLRAIDAHVEVLDGDVVRTNLSRGLGFNREGRDENIRRVAYVCELLSRNGVIVIAAVISPYRKARDEARAGEIHHFTGISDPYEAPYCAEVNLRTDRETPQESVEKIWDALTERGLISNDRSAFAH